MRGSLGGHAIRPGEQAQCVCARWRDRWHPAAHHRRMAWSRTPLPGLHRLHRSGHVAITRDEDDRHVRPIDDALLEIETIEVGKRHIENQATRTVDARMLKELL